MSGIRGRSTTTLLLTAAIAAAGAVGGRAAAGQWATADRVQSPGWWPTKDTAPRADFVGSDACRACHPSQSATQPATQMARTAMTIANSPVLRTDKPLTFTSGNVSYQIASEDNRSIYTVTRGSEVVSSPLTWAFGAGDVGQSFLIQQDDGFTEARVSYYGSLHALAFTPGRTLTEPKRVEDAAARKIDPIEIRRCFSCHTTAPITQKTFDPANAIPGITCEACHGPGRMHIAAMKETDARRATEILNPANLHAVESVDFCGACHATLWDVRLMGDTGLTAQRSQPYRLEMSRCWNGGDQRLTCVACHDPHRRLVVGAAAYDDKCLSCHVRRGAAADADHPGRACPVGDANCAQCHMPKFDVPDMHHQFTDHRIQVPGRAPARVGP